MKRVFLLALIVGIVYAQPTLEWDRTYNDGLNGRGIYVDDNEDIYVVGTRHFTIVKYNNNGDVQWSVIDSLGNGDYSKAMGVCGDDQYIYVVGFVFSTTSDIRLARYKKSDGTKDWEQKFEISTTGWDDYAYSIALKGDYLYITGELDHSDSEAELFIQKCEKATGAKIRNHTIFRPTGIKEMVGNDIVVDDNNDIYITGYQSDGNDDDVIVIKVDSGFNEKWKKVYNNETIEQGCGIVIDDANVYIGGYTFTQNTDYDFLIMKYTKTGDSVWTKIYEKSDVEQAYDIALEGNNLYLTGRRGNNILTVKYDKDANFEWEEVYTIADSAAFANAIDVKGDNIYITGYKEKDNNYRMLTLKYKDGGSSSKLITVIQPNGGEDLKIGSVYTIKWDYTGQIDSIVIEYDNEGTGWALDTIAIVENTGSYQWTVPDTPGDSTLLFVSDLHDYDNIWDGSDDYFKISSQSVKIGNGREFTLRYDNIEGVLYYSIEGSNALLEIYRIDGSLIKRLELDSNRVYLRLREPLSSGVYFVVIKNEDKTLSKKITIIR